MALAEAKLLAEEAELARAAAVHDAELAKAEAERLATKDRNDRIALEAEIALLREPLGKPI